MDATVTLTGMFLEGLFAFFSPCVIALIPLYLGYITANDTSSRWKTFAYTVCFVLGICTVYLLMAAGAGGLKSFLQGNSLLFSVVGGMILIFAGLTAAGVIQIPLLERDYRFSFIRKNGMPQSVFSFLLGFFFSFAWTPCIGPMVAGALIMAANASTKAMGYAYIGMYTLGFVIMFLVLGLFTEEVLRFIKKKKDLVKYTQIIGGVLISMMGVYMVYSGGRSIYQLQNNTGSAVNESTESAEQTETVDQMTDAEKYGFTLYDYEGKPVSLTDYAGKTVILNFFGTWCYYCNEELPDLQKIHENRDDVVVLLVAAPHLNGEGDQEYIENYMKEAGYTMKIIYDNDYQVSAMYGISGYPTSCILKPDQNFLGCAPGYVDADTMDKYIEKAQNE